MAPPWQGERESTVLSLVSKAGIGDPKGSTHLSLDRKISCKIPFSLSA